MLLLFQLDGQTTNLKKSNQLDWVNSIERGAALTYRYTICLYNSIVWIALLLSLGVVAAIRTASKHEDTTRAAEAFFFCFPQVSLLCWRLMRSSCALFHSYSPHRIGRGAPGRCIPRKPATYLAPTVASVSIAPTCSSPAYSS